jgi:hypothetical protein
MEVDRQSVPHRNAKPNMSRVYRGIRTHVVKSQKGEIVENQPFLRRGGAADYNNVQVIGNQNIPNARLKTAPRFSFTRAQTFRTIKP